MSRCEVCKVPLSGFLGNIGKIFLKIKPSEENSRVCNKCVGKKIEQPKDRKYKCQLCGRLVSEEHSLEHIKAEEYIIDLIKKDHKQWRHQEPTCLECISYYRKLVKESEI